uniref:Band 7 domain-containing protein n=1 Tax=viral metagenome TaxID=1070528 RepID=A0A6C0J6L7_9ZZZZ
MLFKLLILMSFTCISSAFIFHNVPRGEVGIYYRFGRLIPVVTTSGLHLKSPPPYTWGSTVQITPQTDYINDVQCGASDGTQMIFDEIAVGNHLKADYVIKTVSKFGENYDDYLVKNKVRSQIYVICSKMSSDEIYNTKFDTIDDELFTFLQKDNQKDSESGVVIDFVRMSKPRIPQNLQNKYNEIAQEKLELQIAKASATKLEQVHKNEKEKAVAFAEKQRAVSSKEDERLFEMKNQEKVREMISREIRFQNKLREAEGVYETIKKEAEGNKLLLTLEYLEMKKYEAYYNNAKHYGQINPTLFLRSEETSEKKQDKSSYADEQLYMSKYDKLNQ